MHVGILQFELVIDGAMNLKDKRRVTRSLKDRLHREHMVSVAEVGALDMWNLSMMGVVMCSRDAGHITGVLEAIVAKLQSLPDARLGDYSLQIVTSEDLAADAKAEDGSELWTEDERRED